MKWQVAVRRETARKKLWKPTDHSIVCYKHFQESDFQKSSLERLRKDLVPGAVPTIFVFGKKDSEKEHQQKLQRSERKNGRSVKKTSALRENSTLPTPDADFSTSELPIFLQVDVSGKLLYEKTAQIQGTGNELWSSPSPISRIVSTASFSH